MIKNEKVEYHWGYMIWWLDGNNDDTPNISTAKMVLNSSTISDKHLHDNCFEFIAVSHGEVIVYIDNEANVLRQDGTILIPPNSVHYIENKGSIPAEMTIVYSSSERNYEVIP